MMAELSDQLLVATILAYLAAMIAHAAEFAFGDRAAAAAAPAEGAADAAPDAVAVGAGAVAGAPAGTVPGAAPGRGGTLAASSPHGGTTLPAGSPPDPLSVGTPPGGATPPAGGARKVAGAPDSAGRGPGAAGVRVPPARAARHAGHAAVILTVVAAVAHAGIIVTRGLAAGRLPWGNMYEFAVAITFVGVVGWLAALARWPRLRQLGLFVALADVLLLGAAGLIAYTDVKPLLPALQSTWYVVHVSTIIVASGLLMLGVVPAVMFLIREGWERGRTSFPYHLGRRVPAAAELERLTFRLHAFAFPVWTFGVAAGAIWAEAAWGRYWGWDPKEVWAFIAWVVYAGYLHARATPSVKRTVVAWLAIAGWLAIMMNLWGVNLFFPNSLHSYA